MRTRRKTGRLKSSTVWLPPSVVVQLERESERCRPLETGGVLLGFLDRDDLGKLQVISASGPGPRAIHRHNSFTPDALWQERQIADTYEQSGRIVTYLGDWHSHPGGAEGPSRLDRKTAARIARTTAARARYPLSLILVNPWDGWHVCPYRYARRRLHRITPITGPEPEKSWRLADEDA